MNDTIKQRIETLTPEYRQFVLSDFTEIVTEEAANSFQFDDIQEVVFENAAVLYLLFFLNDDELLEFIQNECDLSHNQAAQATSIILDKIPEDITKLITKTRQYIRHQEQSSEQSEDQNTEPLQPSTPTSQDLPESNSQEHPSSDIPAIRTMNADQAAAQGEQKDASPQVGYQTSAASANDEEVTVPSYSQEDLLKRPDNQ